MLRFALCDDNIRFLDSLKELTTSISKEICQSLKIDIRSFAVGQDLIDDLLSGYRYDLIMLDWDMPGMNGEETGKAIRAVDQNCLIIFITSYSKFAIQASKLTMFRYILKDRMNEELPEALRSTFDKQLFNEKTIQIKEINMADHLIRIRDIISIENRHAKTTVNLKQQIQIVTSRTFLSDHLSYFLQSGFVKPYKGILVNPKEISEIARDHVIMSDRSSYPLSRQYKQDVYFKIQKLMENEI